MNERKEKNTITLSNKQCITLKKNYIKTCRSNNERKYNNLISLIDSTLDSFEIDRARYDGGGLEGTSIPKLFQTSKFYHALQTKIMTIITDDPVLTNLDDQVNRYIEICTLFDSLFSISRTPCGELDHNKLNNLKEAMSLCLI